MSLLILVTLLVCPVLALVRLSQTVGPSVILVVFAGISLTTWGLYWHDKWAAETAHWRTPEAWLHFFEIIGGWPAAFLAQRIFRHKISKLRYQITFWMIIAIHQVVAFSFVKEWQYATLSWQFLEGKQVDHEQQSPELPIVVPGQITNQRRP